MSIKKLQPGMANPVASEQVMLLLYHLKVSTLIISLTEQKLEDRKKDERFTRLDQTKEWNDGLHH